MYVQAQSVTLKSDDVLRADPLPTAASVAALSANAKGEMIERKGFWVKIKSGQFAGWLKLSSLTIEQAGGGASLLTSLASGRTGTGNVVSASGTRGLSAEELKAARPDMNAVEAVKRLAVSDAEATKYAQAGSLVTRKLAYLTVASAPKK